MSSIVTSKDDLTRIRWFVMSAYKNEKKAEEKLSGKDGLEYFIPKCYAVRVYHGVKSKRLVPVIPNLVFVHASRKQITDFKKYHNFLQFVTWEKSTGLEYLVVPDEQMESFITIASRMDKPMRFLIAWLLQQFGKDKDSRSVAAFADVNGFE